MSYEQKDGMGALFRVDNKETDQHPDYTGSITVSGVACFLSGWIKKSKGGKTYMSLSVKPKEARRDAPRDQVEPQEDKRPFDDDIPF